MQYTFLTNTKAYAEGTGTRGETLLNIHEEAQKEFPHIQILYAPQSPYLSAIAQATQIALCSQHCDNIHGGSHTGYLPPETLQDLHISCSLINHSEHRLPMDDIICLIKRLKDCGVASICCAANLDEIENIYHYRPDYIAFESPELIGGDVSIASAHPTLIEDASRELKETPLLVGSGIKTKADITEAIRLGAQGVIVSSGIVTAADPKEVLFDLLSGFPKA